MRGVQYYCCMISLFVPTAHLSPEDLPNCDHPHDFPFSLSRKSLVGVASNKQREMQNVKKTFAMRKEKKTFATRKREENFCNG